LYYKCDREICLWRSNINKNKQDKRNIEMVFPDWFRVFRPIELLEIFMSLLILNQTVLKSILSKILIYCILII